MDHLCNRFDEELARSIVEGGADRPSGLPKDLGFVSRELEAGRLVVTVDVDDRHMNPFGVAHGGLVSALIDHCLGVVMWPLCPAGGWPATTQFTTHLLAPVRAGELSATATVKYLRKDRAVVDVDVRDDTRCVALAQGTVVITAPRPAA